MKNRWRTWLSLIIVIVLSWLELQFFSESNIADVDGGTRKAAHIAFFAAIMGAGYFAWHKHPVPWLRHIWLLSYTFSFLLVLIVGIVNWKFIHLNTAFLDEISGIRLFFCSPVPFIMLLAAPRIRKKLSQPATYNEATPYK